MSKCDPVDEYGPAPDYQYIPGTLNQFGDLPKIAPNRDLEPRLRDMWNEGCTLDNTYYLDTDDAGSPVSVTASDAGDEGFERWEHANIAFGDPVECRIPDGDGVGQWKDVWERARANGENNHDFLSEPLKWIRTELSNLMAQSVHWWLEVDDPFDVYGDFGAGARSSDSIRRMLVDSTLFTVGVVAVMSLLFIAGRMALQRNAQPAREMLRGLLTLVVVSGAGFLIITTLLEAGDRFSRYFIVKALYVPPSDSGNMDVETGQPVNYVEPEKDPCVILGNEIKLIPLQFDSMNFFLFLACAIFVLVASMILFFYMIARVFVLTLLTGLLPLSAAGTATEAGREWFRKQTGYIMAFILVKPAATVVFCVALRLSDGYSNGTVMEQLTSTFFLFMGTVMLPALTRLSFPFTSAAAGGDKGAQGLAVAPVAVGAKVVQSGVSGLRK